MATQTGNAADNNLVGGTGADSLLGYAGDDTLDGGCSALIFDFFSGIESYTDGDTMRGGAGNDWYKVTATLDWLWATDGSEVAHEANTYATFSFGAESYPDEVIEAADAGIDTVEAFVSYGLPANVENLLLSEAGRAENGDGNELDNVITGNSRTNTLEGRDGDDTLDGSGGFDVAAYVHATLGVTVRLDVAGDQDTGGAGVDRLISIESLSGSPYADRLSGTTRDDLLFGSGGGDTLLGLRGADLLIGGSGDDSLVGGKGADTASYSEAQAGVAVSLALTTAQATGGSDLDTLISFEHLIGSAFADSLYGSGAGNRINGGTGNDRLYGREGSDDLIGGGGKDTLAGGPGGDDFIFTGAPNGRDVIVDFIHLTDRVTFSTKSEYFAALRDGDNGVHPLDPARFHAGATATAPGQRVLYDQSTGSLYYDPDGSGGEARVKIATLGTSEHPTLTADDVYLLARI